MAKAAQHKFPTEEGLGSSLGLIRDIYKKKGDFWKKEREEHFLKVFRLAAEKVPAYRDFLKKHGIDPKDIRNFTDFQKLPPMSKDNYLRNYSLAELCIDGTLEQPLVFTSTSGSTGKPFYFPRNNILDWQFSILCEQFLNDSTFDRKKSTLILVCFGMGVWIGGLITYQAFKIISERGYPITILTPGVNKKEIYDALINIGSDFDQVIMCGYPPFLKDVIDEGEANNIDWRKHNLKMLFAAEAFSEKFRDYITRKAYIKDPMRDALNTYGSAELGGMAKETPLCVLIRRLAIKNKKLYKRIFTDATRLPTLAQFHPDFVNFESVDKNIYCTGLTSLPLIRYQIGDNGGVVHYTDMESIFQKEGISLREEAKKAGIENTFSELPFVYVYERTDLSTKLYGAIIYPEYVKTALFHRTIDKYVTGRFSMYTKFDSDQNEYLEINVELMPNTQESTSLRTRVTKLVSDSLIQHSAEHKNNASMMPGRVDPVIIFWPHEHPTHFKSGIKQKWVKKEEK
jgi:phenylacetate-CoA ligase